MSEIKKPTDKQLLAWWAAQPRGDRTCTDCGVTRDSAYVQPQHPFYADGQEGVARCGDCINKRILANRAARKEALAREPRCVNHPGTRGTYTVAGVLICGRCLKKARAAHYRETAGFGILGGLAPVGPDDVIRWTK